MWLLTCDGDLLQGKRIWLRPGTTHLLGRTTGRSEEGHRIQYIDAKSVSRKHLTIEVASVQPNDSAQLFSRSRLTVTDGSKLGTTLNGEKIVQQTKSLDGKDYTIKLGSYEHLFHLTWHPVTLSFTAASKKSKHEALTGPRKDALERADVKLITDYVSNETTHAVAKKRNTPAALQALLQGRWLVTDAFVDALSLAITPDPSAEAALLEQDFDANWPNEEQYFVPAAGEPIPRDNLYLKPNRDRMEVFQHYTFVFLSQAQFDPLLPVITAGGGKALLRDVDAGKDSVQDVADYVKEIAGRKGSASFRLSQQSGEGGVVVVRWHERDEKDREFMRQLDVILDQRSMEQNEFLDAILTVDASGLRRLLDDEEGANESHGTISKASSRAQKQQRQPRERATSEADSPRTESPSQQEAPINKPPASELLDSEGQPAVTNSTEQDSFSAPKRRNRRIITQSRFQGFDDFDPSQFAQLPSASPETAENGENAREHSPEENMDVDEQPRRSQQGTRKRPAPDPEAEDMYASLLPSHAAMKKRRLEAVQNGSNDPYAKALNESESRPAAAKTTRSKKKEKELDVLAKVQASRKKQEEERRREEEYLRQGMEGVDIKDLKDVAQVEEMEVPARSRPQRNGGEDEASDRWDPAWNGRKNFKKFRRQGQTNGGPQLRRVIVTLEEVPRKGHGIGDEYWLSSSISTNRSKTKSQSQSQHARRSQADGDDDEDGLDRFRRRLQKSREEDEEEALAHAITPEEIAGRARDETIQNAANSTPSQTLRTESQRQTTSKRPATQQGGGPAKRAKQTTLAPGARRVINLDEEEDDDGLKFRRRR